MIVKTIFVLDCHTRFRTPSHSLIIPRFNERFTLSLDVVLITSSATKTWAQHKSDQDAGDADEAQTQAQHDEQLAAEADGHGAHRQRGGAVRDVRSGQVRVGVRRAGGVQVAAVDGGADGAPRPRQVGGVGVLDRGRAGHAVRQHFGDGAVARQRAHCVRVRGARAGGAGLPRARRLRGAAEHAQGAEARRGARERVPAAPADGAVRGAGGRGAERGDEQHGAAGGGRGGGHPAAHAEAAHGPLLVFLASTTNGYEGTGRSLSLKLIENLRKQLRCKTHDGAAAKRLREIDPVERWLLCLNANNRPDEELRMYPDPALCQLFRVNRDSLFCFNAISEHFLQRA